MPRNQEALARLIAREGVSPAVVEAFRSVDRAGFVPAPSRMEAYGDRPVGIPGGQTTSQPSLIARMIDAAAVTRRDAVLEVGTGHGFQTALLAALAERVISIERLDELVADARANLERAGVINAEVVAGDGRLGAPEHAPYGAVIVSAGAEEIPPALVEQLDEGGRLVIPLRSPMGDDVRVFKKHHGALDRGRLLTPARFVPLLPGEPP
ncbi:MAG: protein-L-isoaspartate(D-aspartate) O-methyltransferase [Actinomycetota bacterium]